MILQLSVSLLIFFYLDTAQAGTPSIDRCPGTIFRRVASSDATASVTWEEPDCNANAQSTHSQGFKFGPGVHTVIYWFAGGSVSNPNERCCSFDIVVSGPDFDLCSQNSCLLGEICVPEIDRYYCYPGTTNIKIRNCSSRVFIRNTEADSVTAEWVEPTAFDHYGQLLQPISVPQISPGSALSLGEHDVTYIFSDRGRQATCIFQIRVAQITGPGFQNCPQDITVISAELMVRVEWLEPMLQPNEDSTRITVSQSHSPGQLFPVPSNTMVSYTFTNSESGLFNTCTFQIITETMHTVTVDQQPNRFVRIPQNSQNSEAWPRLRYSRSGNARNIPLVIIPSRVQPEVSSTNTHMYGKGFYPVTYNLTDADGNLIGTSNFIVTYHSGQDSTSTLRQCSGRIDISSEIPVAVSWNIPYLDGNEIGLIWTDEPDVRPNEDLLPVGDTVLEYMFYSPGSPTPIECRITVSITDRIPPRIINCPDAIDKTAPRGMEVSVEFPVTLNAIDGPDGKASVITATQSMSSPLSVPSGETRVIIYTATDTYGNVGQCVLFIRVMTEDPPPVVITKCSDHTLFTSEDITVQLDTSVYPSATGGSGIPDIPATLNPSSFMVNTETTVEATFPSLEGVPFIGDRTCTFNVLALDDIPPVVNNCTQEVTLEAMKGEDFVRVNWTEPTSVDSLEGGSLVNRTHAPLDPFPVGETTVVWYIFKDEAGFQTFCSINITIEKVPFEPCGTQPIKPEDNSELFSFTSDTIVVIVVTAVATFVFSLAIFLLSLCCCTCCCVVDAAETNTSNDSSSDNNQRTRLFVKIGGKNIPIYGPATPLSTNNDARAGRQIDDGEFDYDTSQPTSNRAYQNEAPKLPSVSESVFSDTPSNVATGNNYIEENGGREHDSYGYDSATGDRGLPPPRPPKPGKQENASKMMRKKTFLEMQAAVQNIREEQAWKGRVVDDGNLYGFDQPAN